MTRQSFMYDGSSASLKKAIELSRAGQSVLCPVCGASLKIATTLAEANSQGIHPGVVCPADSSHVFETFYTQEHVGFWDDFEKEIGTGEDD